MTHSPVTFEIRPTGQVNGAGEPCAFAVKAFEGDLAERVVRVVSVFRQVTDPTAAWLRAVKLRARLDAGTITEAAAYRPDRGYQA